MIQVTGYTIIIIATTGYASEPAISRGLKQSMNNDL
jgi:hypothetical protein